MGEILVCVWKVEDDKRIVFATDHPERLGELTSMAKKRFPVLTVDPDTLRKFDVPANAGVVEEAKAYVIWLLEHLPGCMGGIVELTLGGPMGELRWATYELQQMLGASRGLILFSPSLRDVDNAESAVRKLSLSHRIRCTAVPCGAIVLDWLSNPAAIGMADDEVSNEAKRH